MPTGAMTVPRLTLKMRKWAMPNFWKYPPLPQKSWNTPFHSLACETAHPYKTWHSIPWGLLPSEMAHILSMECASPWIKLISLYYGSLLKSFLCGASNPHLVAIPGTQKWSGTWPSSSTPLPCLQQIPLAAELAKTESCDIQPTTALRHYGLMSPFFIPKLAVC